MLTICPSPAPASTGDLEASSPHAAPRRAPGMGELLGWLRTGDRVMRVLQGHPDPLRLPLVHRALSALLPKAGGGHPALKVSCFPPAFLGPSPVH